MWAGLGPGALFYSMHPLYQRQAPYMWGPDHRISMYYILPRINGTLRYTLKDNESQKEEHCFGLDWRMHRDKDQVQPEERQQIHKYIYYLNIRVHV